MKVSAYLSVGLLVGAFFSGCAVPPEQPSSSSDCQDCGPRIPDDELPEVVNVLDSSCALSGCHSGETPKGGMDLSPAAFSASTIQVASVQVVGMSRVEPGQPDKSYLLHKLRGTHLTVGGKGSRMPLGGETLDADVIAAVEAWILEVDPLAEGPDSDGDGYRTDADCDDTNAGIHPDADEVPGNFVDEDCSGVANDTDADGFEATTNGGADCDDTSAAINPDASEVTGNAVDEDCSGAANDVDGDAYDALANGGDDWDDSDPSVYPGALEVCDDGKDNNQNGTTDADCDDDGDDDGSPASEDCNDGDPAINPFASEVTGNTVDEDCSTVANDKDADGYDTVGAGPLDCNDTNVSINPGAIEVSGNAVDEDCNGEANDIDGDGFDATTNGGTDDDDSDATIYPNAPEFCHDGKDNDQNGTTDTDCDTSLDGDSDTYSVDTGDCDDDDAAFNPGATDIKDDGIDQNCDDLDATDATFTWLQGSIFSLKCAGCHSPQPTTGLNLTSGNAYSNIVGVASSELPSMNRVTAGDSAESYLFHKVSGTHSSVGGSGVRMPASGDYLSTQELIKIKNWIEHGAQNN